MVAFVAGLVVGALVVTIVLGAHLVRLTDELRGQIDKLKIEPLHR